MSFQTHLTRTDFNDGAYGDGIFAAVYGTNIYSSIDGRTWTTHSPGIATNLAGVGYGNGTFVAVGQGGLILQSDLLPPSPAMIVEPPASLKLKQGDSAALSTVATGSDPKMFQWLKDGVPIPAATNSTYIVGPASAEDAGSYSVAVSNEHGSVTSQGAPLAVEPKGVPLDFWHLRHSRVTGVPLRKVAGGKGVYAALDFEGVVRISSDGMTWPVARALGTNRFNNIRFINNGFVAVGDQGSLASSSDGLAWVLRPASTAESPTDIAYGTNLYTLVGKGGEIFTSPDLVSWIRRFSRVTESLNAIAFVNQQFVAVGARGTILISKDGGTWSWSYAETQDDLYAVTGGNGTHVAVGDFFTAVGSADGEYWRDSRLDWFRGIPPDLRYVEHAGDRFFLGGEGYYAGATFNPVGVGGAGGGVRTQVAGTAVADDLVLGVGEGGALLVGFNPPDLADAYHFRGIGCSSNLLVAVGRFGTIMVSSNGFSWIKVTSPVSSHLNKVAYGRDLFVAVGDSGTILTSGDAFSWEAQTPVVPDRRLVDVIYGNGLFVAATSSPGALLTSSDGKSWIVNTNVGLYPQEVVYGNGIFVVREATSILRISADGINWTSSTSWQKFSARGPASRRLAYGNGQFLLIADDFRHQTILTSPDAENWTPAPMLGYQAPGAARLRFGGNQVLAVGSYGEIASSDDTYHWMKRESGNAWALWDAVFFNNTFIAVGDYGTILQSDPLTDTTPSIVGQPQSQDVQSQTELRFAVGVIGTSPLTYQWRFNGNPIPAATNSVLTLTAVQASQAGLYDAVVSNRFGTQTSAPARLTVGRDHRVARLAIRYGSSGQLELVLVGMIGAYYEIQSRDQVAGPEEWRPAAFIEELEDSIVWPIPPFTDGTARFYRAVLLE